MWVWVWMNGDIEAAGLFSLTTRLDPPRDADVLSYPSSFTPDVDSTGDIAGASSTGGVSLVVYSTSLLTQFCKWRLPFGFGLRFVDFSFDGLPYFDLPLRDLGL